MNIEAEIRKYVASNLLFGDEKAAFADDESFLGAGIIDSLGVVELVSFISAQFGIAVPPEDITPENFDSVGSVSDYIRRQQSAAA